MGLCASVGKDPESGLELRLSVGSKNEKLLIASAVKQELGKINGGDRAAVADLAVKSGLSSRFRDAGSKDDAFFDSQPWLESDCEDDFVSVNGDFTPSRGSTPVHHKFSSGNPKVNNAPITDETLAGSVTEASPNKKRLSELFKESLRREHYADEENAANVENMKDQDPVTNLSQSKSTNGIDAKSTVEKTPDGVFEAEDEFAKSAQCCLPSFNERKKKMSPVVINA